MSTSADRHPIRHRCVSVAETEAHGEQVGRQARPGEVYGLSGDLGAGKTAWVRGFARGIGFRGRVHSPTFALVNEYEGGRMTVHHLDLYRLGSREEIRGAGLEEYLIRPEGVSVVEWVDRWCPAGAPAPRGAAFHRLNFVTVSPEEREIHHDPVGL